MHLLIPYVRLVDHPDPLLNEHTYGDVSARARKLKKVVRPGDYLFFHTTLSGRKVITAYYCVERVMDTFDAIRDPDIRAKYKSPHLERVELQKGDEDVLVFGNPLKSRVLQTPLPFDKALAKKLSLGIRFPRNRSVSQAIGSATRSWRELTTRDLTILRKEMERNERSEQQDSESLRPDSVLSTEEVTQVLERHLEDLLAHDSQLIGKRLKVRSRQEETDTGRMDLLLESASGDWTVVELKLGTIGPQAIRQLRNYMAWLKNDSSVRRKRRKVSGVIVCGGVLPAFREEFKHLKNIRIFCYGWQLSLRPLH